MKRVLLENYEIMRKIAQKGDRRAGKKTNNSIFVAEKAGVRACKICDPKRQNKREEQKRYVGTTTEAPRYHNVCRRLKLALVSQCE